jgi:hypothetical protein
MRLAMFERLCCAAGKLEAYYIFHVAYMSIRLTARLPDTAERRRGTHSDGLEEGQISKRFRQPPDPWMAKDEPVSGTEVTT